MKTHKGYIFLSNSEEKEIDKGINSWVNDGNSFYQNLEEVDRDKEVDDLIIEIEFKAVKKYVKINKFIGTKL